MCLSKRRRRESTRKTHIKRKAWSARKARWRHWKIFGVDWDYVETKLKIIDIMRSKRHQIVSKPKCKINDAEKRPIRKLKVNNFKIHKQPGICVNPRLTESYGEEKMFKNIAKKSKVKRKASSQITGGTPNCSIKTSPDFVSHFFFQFKSRGKMTSRKKLSQEDISGIAVSDFFYHLRRSRKLKKKKIRNGERRVGQSRNIFCDAKKPKNRELRVRRTRKKKKPGIKSARVLVKKGPVHRGPRYNISMEEVIKTYERMRKGKFFYASKKVLWKNRHALVLGCSNFYGKGKDDEYFKVDNKEYDIVEPPEPSPDPEVPTTGSEFSSDETGDGPIKNNFHLEKKKYVKIIRSLKTVH